MTTCWVPFGFKNYDKMIAAQPLINEHLKKMFEILNSSGLSEFQKKVCKERIEKAKKDLYDTI